MANKKVKFIPVVVEGETYQLFYDFNTLCNAERAAGCNLLHGMISVVSGEMNSVELRGMLYAALREGHPKITVEEAGKILQDSLKEGSTDKIREAMLELQFVSFERVSAGRPMEQPPVTAPQG